MTLVCNIYTTFHFSREDDIENAEWERTVRTHTLRTHSEDAYIENEQWGRTLKMHNEDPYWNAQTFEQMIVNRVFFPQEIQV